MAGMWKKAAAARNLIDSMHRRFPAHAVGITTLALMANSPLALADQPAAGVQSFEFHHANVLGTAMDLTVFAPSKVDAEAVEKAVLAEIDRLKKILSAYDAEGEVARLNASPVNGPALPASPELIEVLKQYDASSKRTAGAYSGHAGDVIVLWKQGEKDGRLPTDAELLAAATRNKAPAWEIDETAKTVRRIADQQINVDSLGKGYIIDKAVEAATAKPGSLKGLMLNIGGDLRTWGTPAPANGGLWAIGVQDPAHPELNAKPLTTVFVPGKYSVSSSGAYQRFYTINGKRYSHIIDARTGKSGRNQAATVVAPDSATANALATICCTLRFAEALELVRSIPNAEALIVTADGHTLRTEGFKALQDKAQAAEQLAPRTPSLFPAGYKLAIDLQVPTQQHRPYVFAWVTDGGGKYVKTLAAYGNERRWLTEMKE
ncbi:MAG: apbE 3, partial [Phycisphaerales bacterium]|nr:apbE 3 [Phycisphaerales bacterium]